MTAPDEDADVSMTPAPTTTCAICGRVGTRDFTLMGGAELTYQGEPFQLPPLPICRHVRACAKRLTRRDREKSHTT